MNTSSPVLLSEVLQWCCGGVLSPEALARSLAMSAVENATSTASLEAAKKGDLTKAMVGRNARIQVYCYLGPGAAPAPTPTRPTVPTPALYTDTFTGVEYIRWPADLPPPPSNDVLGARHAMSKFFGETIETLYDRRLVEYARAGGDLSKPVRFDLKTESYTWSRPDAAGARGTWSMGPKTWAWQEIVEAYRTAGELPRAFPDDGSEWATEQNLAKTYAAYQEAKKSGIVSRTNDAFAAYAKAYEDYFNETLLRDVMKSLYSSLYKWIDVYSWGWDEKKIREMNQSAIAEMEMLWPGWYAWKVAYDQWLDDLLHERHLPQWYRTTRELTSEALNAALQVLPFLPQARGLRITAAPYVRAGGVRALSFIKPPAPTPRPTITTVPPQIQKVVEVAPPTPAPPRPGATTSPGATGSVNRPYNPNHLTAINEAPASRPTQPAAAAPPAPRTTEPAALPAARPQPPARQPIPGDTDYTGTLPKGSWKLSPSGQGAHLIERHNVATHPGLKNFDLAETPRYYPRGTPENAGQAHIRLHGAAARAAIERRGGNPNLAEGDLIGAYRNAYSDSALQGIRGDLRTPDGKTVIATDVTPSQAFEALLRWSAGR